MDRKEWERRCAQRYQEIMQLDDDEAASMARENADLEASGNGDDVAQWSEPDQAANDDMSYWSEG